ncbi:MAG: right-handed parallel beta-helix repeat-containing protein, partial [Ginsengibacter sp.]
MKKSLLFTFLSFIIGLSVNATDYFVASNGYDGNNGTSQSSPWQSLDKLNASFASLRPGDRVLLRRGDTFYGSINVNRSGSAGAPITITAYGSGEKPVITGFTTVDSWNNLGGNIWESSTAVSSQPYTNMVSVNGVNTAMGRYPNSTGPNTGYLTIKSHSGSYSITTNQLSGGPNWTGADVVIRKEKFTLERGTISSQSGGTLNYSDRSGSAATNGFGFFIQNDPRTLDMNGEWYYNPSSKKIRIFNSSYPGDVKVASIKNLISVTRQSYIVIDNLSLIGSNEEAVSSVDYGSNLVVQNCDISMSGTYGVHTKMDHTTVQYCNISNTNYSAILTVEAFGIIKNNNINNVNMLEGMEDQIASSDFMSAGIYTNGANSEITNNKIERSGYAAINMGGGYTVVKNNFVNGFCYIKEDGGGIYSGSQARTHGSVIDGNIVINGIGARAGCLDSMNNDLAGIFLDVYSSGITISNNTVANVVTSGIKLHGATDIIIQGNTTYNNGGSSWARGGLQFLAGNDWRIKNITVKSNIFFAKTPEQVSFFNYPPRDYVNDTKTFGSSDNNYYAKPIDNNSAMEVFPATYNLQGWKSLSGMDGNSEGAPKSVPSVDDLRFEYNASPNAKTISLDGNYIDVRYNSFNGSITLEPYRSAVLMRDGAAQKISIVVTAGDDQTISLPLNNVVLNGKVTSNGISITNNNWTKVSGPSSSYIESPNEASTSISNLTEGVYVFQYKGTASNGSTATANVQVNVIKSAG